MVRSLQLNVRDLIEIIGDKNRVIGLINTKYPELEACWLDYKGNLVIPSFCVSNTINIWDNNVPVVNTRVQDDHLSHTGILSVESKQDIRLLKTSNEGKQHLQPLIATISKTAKKSNVNRVRLLTPASSLIFLLTGLDKTSKKLREELCIQVPSGYKNGAILSAISKAVLRSSIPRDKFFNRFEGLSIDGQVEEEDSSLKASRKEKYKQDRDLLVQPDVKLSKHERGLLNAIEFLNVEITRLKEYESTIIENTKRNNEIIEQLKINNTELERDQLEVMERMEPLIKARDALKEVSNGKLDSYLKE